MPLKGRQLFKAVLGAALTVLCGLALWKMPLGETWVNLSYDYLFRFGERPVTNQVVAILMDNEAHDFYQQERETPWDRARHAELLQRLADDDCALVVLDVFFRVPRDPGKDAALTNALRRLPKVVLMAEQSEIKLPGLEGAHPTLPDHMFLDAARQNWGVAWLDSDLDQIVRHHWPFPNPGLYPSLPWVAAKLAGVQLDETPRRRWLRYYGAEGPWPLLSYRFALGQPTNYYRNKIVFIGSHPHTTIPNDEKDEFSTPYTHWTGESMGGVQINITSLLNLMNGEWLERANAGWEALVLILAGGIFGGTLVCLRKRTTTITAIVATLVITLAGVWLSHSTNYWFPWLVIAGGQLPCALAYALVWNRVGVPTLALEPLPAPKPVPPPPQVTVSPPQPVPEAPDYEILSPPFGHGAYGKVWLVRNAVGQWQALKAVYQSSFGEHSDAYEREFSGIKNYKPVSDKHPGLLRVDFVSQKKPDGYFYYVMELGDPLKIGWESEPSTYKPRDLITERNRFQGRRLPVRDCLRLGAALCEALEFLHGQGLTHRDIKPQNIIFVRGRPKLADVGLIAEIRPPDQKHTYVGTPGYLPPPPELPGTVSSDLYALGMMLFVLSTGQNPTYFPEITATLAGSTTFPDFFVINTIILKACQPESANRYATAAEFHAALKAAQAALDQQDAERKPPTEK